MDAALTAAGPVNTANHGVNNWVVYACNDWGALGATNALKNAGFTPDNLFTEGLGAYEACRPWNGNIPTGFKAALYISGVDAGDAVARALLNSIETGEPSPAKSVANTTIVDLAIFAEIMPCRCAVAWQALRCLPPS